MSNILNIKLLLKFERTQLFQGWYWPCQQFSSLYIDKTAFPKMISGFAIKHVFICFYMFFMLLLLLIRAKCVCDESCRGDLNLVSTSPNSSNIQGAAVIILCIYRCTLRILGK